MVNIVRISFHKKYSTEFERAWKAFEEIRPHPFDHTDIENDPLNGPPSLNHPRAKAQAHISREDDRVGIIRIADGFFDKQDPQRLILLHEMIHLRLQGGRLHRNHKAMRSVQLENGEEPGTDRYAFIDHRASVAIALGDCVQEIACDRYVHEMYPALRREYFEERLHYYLEPNSYLTFKEHDRIDPSLQPYVTLYRLIRAEAGTARYEHDPETQLKLWLLREKYRAALQQERATDADSHNELRLSMHRTLGVRFAGDADVVDEDDYMALFHQVLGLAGLRFLMKP